MKSNQLTAPVSGANYQNWNITLWSLALGLSSQPCFRRVSTKTCHQQPKPKHANGWSHMASLVMTHALQSDHCFKFTARHVLALLQLGNVGNAEVLRVELHHLQGQVSRRSRLMILLSAALVLCGKEDERSMSVNALIFDGKTHGDHWRSCTCNAVRYEAKLQITRKRGWTPCRCAEEIVSA